MFLCKYNYVIFWQTNKPLANAKIVFRMFFLFFCPEQAYKQILRVPGSCSIIHVLNFLSRAGKDNLLEFTYLPESNVLSSTEKRFLHIHFTYLSVVHVQVKHLKTHFKSLNFTS